MIYQDVPQCPSNVFVLYSNATGKQNYELSAGIDVSTVIHKPVITSQTRMTITSGSSGFNRDGLHIKPTLSADGKQITFDLTMTACNMTISGYLTLTVKTAGDEETELQGVTKTIQLKVICYGFDRPFLGRNFVEYDAHDGSLYRESVMPFSCNALASVGFGESTLDGSGFVLYDRDNNENINTVYYTGSPSAPGLYGLVVAASTYEGGANTPGIVPNSFPGGSGADSLIISIYDGYFKKNDIAFAVPGKVDLEIENAPVNAPAGFNHVFTLYGGNMISGGSYASTGGAFTPVFNGKAWLYWERKQVNQVANNTTETHEYRLLCNADPKQPSGKLSDTWYLYYRYYIDKNNADWTLLETTAGVAVNVPVKEGSNVTTRKAFVSVPPYSGWKDAEASGDAAYFVKGYDFFNTVSLVSPDNAFEPITVYAGNNNRLLVKSSEQNGKVFFPELAGWGIVEDGKILPLDNAPQTIQHTVMPYAPPKEGDAAIGVEVQYAPSKESGSGTETLPVNDFVSIPQALNYQNTDICIYSNGTAGGIWKRYPLQRLIQSGFANKLYAVVSGSDKSSLRKKSIFVSDDTTSGGTARDRNGSVLMSQKSGETTNTSGNKNAGVVTASFESEFPMNGVVSDNNGMVSFYGFSDKDSMKIRITPTDWESKRKIETGGYHNTYKRWVEDDIWETVTKPGYGSHEIMRTQGKKKHIDELEDEGEGSTHEYIETRTHKEASGSGDEGHADCLLRVGQADTAAGRVLTFAPSAVGWMRGSKTYDYIIETKEIVDGKVIASDRTVQKITAGANINGITAEAYARMSLPNNAIGSRRGEEQHQKVQSGSFHKRFSIRKRTAFTCYKYKYDVTNERVGSSEYEVHWYPPGSAQAGDRVVETFEYECYSNVGEYSETVHTYLVEEAASGSLYYNGSTYSLELYKGDKNTYSRTTVNTEEWNYDPETYEEYSEKSSTDHWSQSVTGGYHIKITQDFSTGKFIKTKTVNPSISISKGETMDEYPEAETEVTEGSYTGDGLLRMFEDFYSEANAIDSNFETPDGEWDITTRYADASDSPLYPTGGSCEYSYEYSDDSVRPLVMSVDFKLE